MIKNFHIYLPYIYIYGVPTYMQIDIDRHICRQTQIDIYVDRRRQTYMQIDVDRHICRQKYKQIDVDRHICRQTQRHICRQTDRHICRQTQIDIYVNRHQHLDVTIQNIVISGHSDADKLTYIQNLKTVEVIITRKALYIYIYIYTYEN